MPDEMPTADTLSRRNQAKVSFIVAAASAAAFNVAGDYTRRSDGGRSEEHSLKTIRKV